MNTSPVIFKSKIKQSDSVGTLKKILLHRRLKKSASAHLRENRKKLVVFSFDHIGNSINVFGVHEKVYLDFLFQWLSKKHKALIEKTCALDIGANIGNHSLYFSDYFKNVYSFEPHPRTFGVLKLNAELSNNIQAYCMGLSSKEGSAELFVNQANMGSNSLVVSSGETIHIKLDTLDHVAEGWNEQEVGMMKIDVEGHELDVLIGATETIKKHQPIILFEQHSTDFKNGESEVVNKLNELGYKKFAIINHSPNLSNKIPKLLRQGLTVLGRLILGSTMELRMVESITPGNYTFIVALPDNIEGGY